MELIPREAVMTLFYLPRGVQDGLLLQDMGWGEWVDTTFLYTPAFEKAMKSFIKLMKLYVFKKTRGSKLELKEGLPEYSYSFRSSVVSNKLTKELMPLTQDDISEEYVQYCIEKVMKNQSRMLYLTSRGGAGRHDTSSLVSFIIYSPVTVRRSKRIQEKKHISPPSSPKAYGKSYWCCESYIDLVCTHQDYQGMGLTKHLFKKVQTNTRKWCSKSQSSTALMSLHPVDPKLIGLYKYMGFEHDGPAELLNTRDLMNTPGIRQ